MDESKTKTESWVRNHLKTLLLHLAAKSENPSSELSMLLREVIDELHAEVKETLKKKPNLKLVAVEDGSPTT